MYVWGKSNQATNIKRNRDDNNDNSKENKQWEKEHTRNLFISSVKTTYLL
jgi:hypothetical protein